jgi:hypothetical protein
MTSEDDHDYIVNFFQKRDYFGLPRESIKFFQQVFQGKSLLIS